MKTINSNSILIPKEVLKQAREHYLAMEDDKKRRLNSEYIDNVNSIKKGDKLTTKTVLTTFIWSHITSSVHDLINISVNISESDISRLWDNGISIDSEDRYEF